MARHNNNGIVALHDDKENDSGFFCMKLVEYLNEEASMGTEAYERLWHERFGEAKAGVCSYREKCPFYAKTSKNKSIQLKLF